MENMNNKPQEKLSETSRKIMLEYLNLGVLNGFKDIGTNRSLSIFNPQNSLSTRPSGSSESINRDPVAETLIGALNTPVTETEKEITQIIPAQGWAAVFAGEPERYNMDLIPIPKFIIKPLICWALKSQFDEAGRKQSNVVVGIIDNKKGTSECSLCPNFLSYRGPGSEKEDYSLIEAWYNWYDARK
jgi:hypothetical protein